MLSHSTQDECSGFLDNGFLELFLVQPLVPSPIVDVDSETRNACARRLTKCNYWRILILVMVHSAFLTRFAKIPPYAHTHTHPHTLLRLHLTDLTFSQGFTIKRKMLLLLLLNLLSAWRFLPPLHRQIWHFRASFYHLLLHQGDIIVL